eukprot:m51a1_g12804 hypothetical protein (73) ;mRNA; f:696-914
MITPNTDSLNLGDLSIDDRAGPRLGEEEGAFDYSIDPTDDNGPLLPEEDPYVPAQPEMMVLSGGEDDGGGDD